MQLLDRIQVTLSRDSSSNPQDILFKKVQDTTDTSTFSEYVSVDQPYAVGTHVLNLGTIANVKFIYIKPTNDCHLVLNGGSEQIKFLAGKASRLFVDVTAISIVVTGASNQIQLVAAGA